MNYTVTSVCNELINHEIHNSQLQQKLAIYQPRQLGGVLLVALSLFGVAFSCCLGFSTMPAFDKVLLIGFIGPISSACFVSSCVCMYSEYRAFHKKFSARERDEILRHEIVHLRDSDRQESEYADFHRNFSEEHSQKEKEIQCHIQSIEALRELS